VSLTVHGGGGAPQVTLIAPGGQKITPAIASGAGGALAVALPDSAGNATYIGIRRPHPGRWSVAAAAGSSVPVTGLEYSIGESPPQVSARVSGRGFARTLHYRARIPGNVTVTFAERTARLLHVIGRATGRSGTIRFKPAFGPAGSRRLIAQITNNGVPWRNRTLASFSVPKPQVGRARGLQVRAGRRAFTFSYRPPGNATRVLIKISATDGRRLQRVLSPRAHGGSVPAVGFRDGVTITVLGVAPDGSHGPAVSARARRRR
jgi:hypothetical protein